MSDSRPILSAIQQGNSHAADLLLPLVYDELRKLATQMHAHALGGPGEVFVAHDQQLHRDTYLEDSYEADCVANCIRRRRAKIHSVTVLHRDVIDGRSNHRPAAEF